MVPGLVGRSYHNRTGRGQHELAPPRPCGRPGQSGGREPGNGLAGRPADPGGPGERRRDMVGRRGRGVVSVVMVLAMLVASGPRGPRALLAQEGPEPLTVRYSQFLSIKPSPLRGQVLLPEERITVSQALALYTTNAAYASFEENIKGSLAPGKMADIVVLSDDPTKILPENIKDIKVEMTIIGGEVVWEA